MPFYYTSTPPTTPLHPFKLFYYTLTPPYYISTPPTQNPPATSLYPFTTPPTILRYYNIYHYLLKTIYYTFKPFYYTSTLPSTLNTFLLHIYTILLHLYIHLLQPLPPPPPTQHLPSTHLHPFITSKIILQFNPLTLNLDTLF